MRERHANGKKNPFKQGHRNQGNPYPYLRKNASYARAMRASDRKTVYPAHEKRNRRNG